ncbi:hypothetical protein [Telluria beijingensis]|uniref:hypothetical protein n=1 Tax=Telluria beijingensis TaxID=3068633 RepID=UPI00279578A6|nr:hypothetical protein [Massilia sp. REN29]
MFRHVFASRSLRGASLALLMIALGTGGAEACRRAPEVQLMSPEKQLAFARSVAVARVISAHPIGDDIFEYRFIVLKRLAGPDTQSFTVQGLAPDSRFASDQGEHADHDGPRFWARGGGRVMNDPSCTLRPWFTLGESYLVILDQPYTRRSFEHIATVDGQFDAKDKWLNYVEARLSPGPR